MARKSSSPKRKRASLPVDALQQYEGNEADSAADPPRKRGRPRKSLDTARDAEEIVDSSQLDGRHSAGRPQQDNGETEPTRRGRKQKFQGPSEQQQQDGEEVDTTTSAQVRKRGRPRKSLDVERGTGIEDKAQDGNEADATASPRPRKRGRPRKSLDVERGTEDDEPHKPAKKRKRGRPSLQKALPSDNNEQDSSRQRGQRDDQLPRVGHKKKTLLSPAQLPQQEQHEVAKKRKRGRPSLRDALPSNINNQGPKSKRNAKGISEAEGQARRSRDEPGEETGSAGTSRRTSSQVALLVAEGPPKPRSLPHIAPKNRTIPTSVIEAKWGPLTAPSINAASETLLLACRPIMQRMSNSQTRRRHAASGLNVAYRRISRHLQRGAPFPPPTAAPTRKQGKRKFGHEAELNFESVLDGVAALERQLDPALHAVELLQREKKKMEEELEKDYQTLRNLEAGAKGETRQRRERLRKMHVLAPEKRVEREAEDLVSDKSGGVPPGMVFKDLEDGELKDLALQLGGHVDSIKANLQQAEGLGPQLASSSASLRSVLSRHLDEEQYDRVVFG